jgi:putative hemolysin
MDGGLPIVPGLLLFGLLLGLNALFVAAEFAYVTVRPTQMRRLATEGDRNARTILKALTQLDFYVAAAQLGITMATIAIGFLGEPVIAAIIEPPVERLVGEFAPAISHTVAIAIAFGFVTGVHIVVGEFMPKTLALQSPDKTSLFLARPMEMFVRLFRPLIWLLNATGNGILRLAGMNVSPVSEEPLRRDDIAMILEGSASAGLISQREFDLTRNTLRLSTLSAETLMVPRSEIIAIPVASSTLDVRRTFARHRYTRYPVFDDTLDNIVGIVDVKNAVFDLAHDYEWHAHIDTPVQLPVSLSVDRAFAVAREAQATLVVLIDEYGGTAGILSVFDVMQYLAGGLPDDQRPPDSRFSMRPDGTFLVAGLMQVVEVADELGITLPDVDAHTVGGLVMERLGHLPETGDFVDVGSYRFTVTKMDERRIDQLEIMAVDSSSEKVDQSNEW